MILAGKKRARKSPKKKLASRAKKEEKALSPGGRVIRLSPEVFSHLEKKQEPGESFDSLMRRMLNLPDRTGEYSGQPLIEMWLLRSTGEVRPTRAKAQALAVLNGAKKGHEMQFERPVRLREVL